jgi:hypothetical protein
VHALSLRAKNELLPELKVHQVEILADELALELDLVAAAELAKSYFDQAPKLLALNATVAQELEGRGHQAHASWVD